MNHRFLSADPSLFLDHVMGENNLKFRNLSQAICTLLEDFSLVSFVPINVDDEDSIQHLLMQVDNAIQYGEDLEPKEPAEERDDVNNDDE